jgi:hypothetical protein
MNPTRSNLLLTIIKQLWHEYDVLMFKSIVCFMIGFATHNIKSNTYLNNAW